MGIPVISPMLIHFSGLKSDRRKLGIVTRDRDEVLKAINFIFSNYIFYKNTRRIAKENYTWDKILSQNIKVYDILNKRYYE